MCCVCSLIPDPFYSLLKPERRAECFTAYREPVNFLKHADKDHDGLLPVYDIVRASDLALLGAIVRLIYLGEQPTAHMRAFLIFVAAQFPNTINFDAIPGLADLLKSEHARQSTRGELAASLMRAIRNGAEGIDELVVDLSDVTEANSRLLLG